LDCDVNDLNYQGAIGCTCQNECFAWFQFIPPPSHAYALNIFLASRTTFSCFEKTVGIGPVFTLSNLLTIYPADYVLSPMAPVVCIEPNGVQTLLLFDNAHEELESNGWLVFIQKFEGFNLAVAQQFSLTFDGCRAKVGDIQLELNEEFLSSATGFPAKG
jgi:hypothetical protein